VRHVLPPTARCPARHVTVSMPAFRKRGIPRDASDARIPRARSARFLKAALLGRRCGGDVHLRLRRWDFECRERSSGRNRARGVPQCLGATGLWHLAFRGEFTTTREILPMVLRLPCWDFRKLPAIAMTRQEGTCAPLRPVLFSILRRLVRLPTCSPICLWPEQFW
jgi:hypothetical protein